MPNSINTLVTSVNLNSILSSCFTSFQSSFMYNPLHINTINLSSINTSEVKHSNTCNQILKSTNIKCSYEQICNILISAATYSGSVVELATTVLGLKDFMMILELVLLRPKCCEKESKNASEDIPNELKEYLDALLVKDRVSDNKDCLVKSPVVVEKKTVIHITAKVEAVRPKQQEKTVNVVKASACWVWRPTKPNGASITLKRHSYIDGHPQKVQEDQGYVDSGYSRHIIRNMSYLSNFKEFDRGYVTFGGGAKGGRITGKLTTAIDVNVVEDILHKYNDYFKLKATTKVKTINGEAKIQALVDKKKVIITETSVRSDLHLEDAQDSQVEGMLKHKEIYVITSHTKKIFANIKRQGKDFFGKVTPLFKNMMVQPQEDMCEDLEIPIDSRHTPIVTQPSTSSQLQQKHKSKKSKKRITEVPQLSDSTHDVAVEHVTTTSNDPLLSGLGDQEDAYKQERMIEVLDADERVVLVDETQERNDQDMLDTSILDDEEVVAEKEVSTASPVTTAGVEVSTTAAKDKGKAKTIEPEKPLKRKDQIMIDEEVARNLVAQMQAELEEEERLARQKEEETNIALIES
nr:hypothetical protein [Tanacetum cinerariifolium]